MTFGERLRACRLRKGIHQKTVADALYLTQGTISAWEHDYTEPSLDCFRSLCFLYDVSADVLLFGSLDQELVKYV